MKKTLVVLAVIIGATALTAGAVKAYANRDITATLGGAPGDVFNVDGTLGVSALRVGAQGMGGVTQFNGTIINNTTQDGADLPVTFGDNVRIDGRVYRGAGDGPYDDKPFIINDNAWVVGDLEVTGRLQIGRSIDGNGVVTTGTISDHAVTDTLHAADSNLETTATEDDPDVLLEKSGTNGESTVFCAFSGYFTTDTDGGMVAAYLLVDGEEVHSTIRAAVSPHAYDMFNVSFNTTVSVESGTHEYQVVWYTDSGATATMYNGSFDTIELKR
ncbi:hypothetical protein KKC06_03660 [Patescibacteria group bacterium]|nr:hypothetical protein [Patescibacteria group bacterium]